MCGFRDTFVTTPPYILCMKSMLFGIALLSIGSLAFGQSMTSLNFLLTRALARELRAGDEVIVTRLDQFGFGMVYGARLE